MTPREYDALARCYRDKERLENYRAGLAPATVLNAFRKENTQPVEPLDFFERKPLLIKSASEVRNSFHLLSRIAKATK
jgi:hypothetical protein